MSVVLRKDPTISFTVVGVPKPQPRAKSTNRGKHSGVYDPGTANDWKAEVARAAHKAIPERITTAVVLLVVCHLPRPKSHYGTGRNAGILKASAPKYHTAPLDVDNFLKAIMDAITFAQRWSDDGIVYDGRLVKQWCPPGEARAVVHMTLSR